MDYENIPGNYYDKYHSSNPIARYLMQNFLREFEALCTLSGAQSLYEFGCGEGELSLACAKKGWQIRGSDIEPESVAAARNLFASEGHAGEFGELDVMEFDPGAINAELIVCCEVLEHLPDPERALRNIVATGSENYLFSVPREPVWRVLNMARGKYIKDLGNTPGHLQHWSTKSFVAMVGRYLEVREIRTPFPWTMILCRGSQAG